jgi:outer membrane protein assembly complex protein YaeT
MMAICLGAARTQEQFYEGKPIVAIEYDPAAQPLAPQDLNAAQPLKIGQALHKEDLANAIDKLFATGRYDDIQTAVQPRGNGVVVRIITKSKSFIGHVGTQGKVSSPPNRGQVVNAAQLSLGQPFDPKDLDPALKNIKDLFVRNGLFDATVQYRLEPVPTTQQMNVVFEVHSGKRSKYTDPVITGDTKLPPKQIVKSTHWHRFLLPGWRPIGETRTRDGIDGVHKKYQSKDRLQAKVELKKLDNDPQKHVATPTVDVNAGPIVKVTTVEAKVPKRKLKEYIPVYDEGAVDNDLLVEGARNLRAYFQNQGYYEVQIDFRETAVPGKDETNIEYMIAKGPQHKLVEVDVKGNKYFRTVEIKERLILHRASLLQFRHGRYSEEFRNNDEATVANLYKENGFQEVKVTSTIASDYKGKTGDIAVTYNIDEGRQWFVSKLAITGMTTPDATRVQRQLSSLEGQPFSEYNVAADRKTILDYYYSNGYPDAKFEFAREQIDANHINLSYRITEGEQQFVRDVIVTGIRTTRQSLIDKNMKLKAGDPLATIQMTNEQRRLYNLGVFAKVDAAIQNPDGEEQRKYVLYDIEEASRYTMSFGFGAEVAQFGPTANELAAPVGYSGFSPRFLVDVSRNNFLGLGQTISFQGRLSNLDQRAIVNYLIPRFRNIEGRNITISGVYDNSRDVLTFASRREEASVQLSQVFTKALTGLFRFDYRRVSTSDVVIPALLVPQLLQPVRIGILSANLSQDRRDNPADAHRGMYNMIDVGVAGNFFGSQRSFGKLIGRQATYTTIRRNWVLARQLTFGAIFPFKVAPGFTAANYIPLPERFFGGGADSDRAFPYNEAGPRDTGIAAGPGGMTTQPTGFPLGGNAVLFHQTELRFPFIGENIEGVIFHDMGNIYSTLGNISFRFTQRNIEDFDYMVHAVGFGIRYRTPVGPIRLDLAYSINPPSFDGFKGTLQQLIQCNPNAPPDPSKPFCTPVVQSTSHFQFFFSIGQAF